MTHAHLEVCMSHVSSRMRIHKQIHIQMSTNACTNEDSFVCEFVYETWIMHTSAASHIWADFAVSRNESFWFVTWLIGMCTYDWNMTHAHLCGLAHRSRILRPEELAHMKRDMTHLYVDLWMKHDPCTPLWPCTWEPNFATLRIGSLGFVTWLICMWICGWDTNHAHLCGLAYLRQFGSFKKRLSLIRDMTHLYGDLRMRHGSCTLLQPCTLAASRNDTFGYVTWLTCMWICIWDMTHARCGLSHIWADLAASRNDSILCVTGLICTWICIKDMTHAHLCELAHFGWFGSLQKWLGLMRDMTHMYVNLYLRHDSCTPLRACTFWMIRQPQQMTTTNSQCFCLVENPLVSLHVCYSLV